MEYLSNSTVMTAGSISSADLDTAFEANVNSSVSMLTGNESTYDEPLFFN